jgi:hypothetical protein
LFKKPPPDENVGLRLVSLCSFISDGCSLLGSLGAFSLEASLARVVCRSSECCRTLLGIIMSLNVLSFSDRSGAVFIESVYACDRSGCWIWRCLSVGEASRGLFSSRIDLVLDSRLNALGLPFLLALECEDGGWDSPVDSMETSDRDGPPTGFLVVDLSTLGSASRIRVSISI